MNAHDVIVSVGTDHHPFDRLVEWVDVWARKRSDVAVFVQHGRSAPPRYADGAPLLPHDQLRTALLHARAVVAHGGPATIMDAREAGHRPLVLPRDPALGEHVDDHQVRFARRLAEVGDVRLVTDEDDLSTALDELLRVPVRELAEAATTTRPEAVGHIGVLIEAVEARGTRRRLPGRPLRRAPVDTRASGEAP